VGFIICTRTTSLTFDLTSDQEKKVAKKVEKTLSQGKKVKKPSEEQQKRIPLQDGQKNRGHVTRMNRVP